MKYTSSLASPTLSEYTIAEFMASGGYAPYLRRVRLFCERHVSVDSLELYKRALGAGIAITPGYLFSATDQYHHFIRLNAANWSDEAEAAIERLGQIIERLGRFAS